MRVQFRRATGQVQGSHRRIGYQELDDGIDRFGRHFLGAVRSGIDVTVHAVLIASVSEIDLEGLDRLPAYRGEVGL